MNGCLFAFNQAAQFPTGFSLQLSGAGAGLFLNVEGTKYLEWFSRYCAVQLGTNIFSENMAQYADNFGRYLFSYFTRFASILRCFFSSVRIDAHHDISIVKGMHFFFAL